MRFVLYLIVFYILYRILKSVFKSFISKNDTAPNIKNNPANSSKYKDVEEADYKEITTDKKNQND